MPIGGLILGLAQSVGNYGQGVRRRTEGEGSYDPSTGKFYDKSKVKRRSITGSFLNPAGAWTDPNLNTFEKLVASTGLGGIFVAGKRADRMEAERAKMAAKYDALRAKVDDLPSYEVAPEAQEKLAAMQETSQELSGIGQEITDIAGKRASRPEMREAQMQRENIKQNSAARLQAIQESGGSQTLGNIAKAGTIEQAELRNLNKKQTAYRFQAENDLMNAKINQSSMEAAGAQLEVSGLGTMISEKGKKYQSNLDKALTGLSLDIARQTGSQIAGIQNMSASQQNQAQAMNSVASIAMSYLANKSMSNASSKNLQLTSGGGPSGSGDMQETASRSSSGSGIQLSGNYGGNY